MSTDPTIVTLDVGGRLFRARKSVVAESDYLNAQISRWQNDIQKDGSFFLDADPDVFAHLLAFMRRPERFPLFWEKAKGFDYELYYKLQTEAEYFGVTALADWIRDEKFLLAVKTITETRTSILEVGMPASVVDIAGSTNKKTHVFAKIRKIYLCPRRIACHRGSPGSCGKACKNYQGDDPDEFQEEPYYEMVTIKNTTLVDKTLLMNNKEDENTN